MVSWAGAALVPTTDHCGHSPEMPSVSWKRPGETVLIRACGGGDPGDGAGELVSLVGGQCAGDGGHALGDVGVERADDLLHDHPRGPHPLRHRGRDARDIGQISATFLLGAAEAPGGAIEIAGDERTGSQIAAAFGEHAGLPARYEALPLQVLGDDADTQAMFRWFARRPPTRPTSER